MSCCDCDDNTPIDAKKEDVPPDDEEENIIRYEELLITTMFAEGPLGITLRRRAADGIIYIAEVTEESQAVSLMVRVNDELWSIGESVIGGQFLGKEDWDETVNLIKKASRPLEMKWRRPMTYSDYVACKAKIDIPVSSPVDPLKYKCLEMALSKLVRKPKEPARGIKFPTRNQVVSSTDYQYLLSENRELLREGDLSTPGGGTLWMKTYNKRHILLLSDMLIVTSPLPHAVGSYQVEHIIDLQACKLRSDGQVFGGSGAVEEAIAPPLPNIPGFSSINNKLAATVAAQAECMFQILWPGGALQLIADNKENKEVWVLNLFLAICACVESQGDGQMVLGWRHQYMLGTMHSAVLSRDELRVRELVAQCEAGELEFSGCIDAFDEEGYTPLHYACILRMHNIIRALHEATADVTAQDLRGFTPLHWAAMQLDDYALSLLCAHVFDIDRKDKQGRTPLYMACVEGRDISGNTDTTSLVNCVTQMLSHQPQLDNFDKYGLTLIHYLAASWQCETLILLLAAGADVNARCSTAMAISGGGRTSSTTRRGGTAAAATDCTYHASFRALLPGLQDMTALHLAAMASPIKAAVGEGARILLQSSSNSHDSKQKSVNCMNNNSGNNSEFEKLHRPYGSSTLRMLLQAGARPNARDGVGRTALHILAEDGREDLWDPIELGDAAAVLISFGARFDEITTATTTKDGGNSISPLAALRARLNTVMSVDALIEKWTTLPTINGDNLNLTLNCFQHSNSVTSNTSSSTIEEEEAEDSSENNNNGNSGGNSIKQSMNTNKHKSMPLSSNSRSNHSSSPVHSSSSSSSSNNRSISTTSSSSSTIHHNSSSGGGGANNTVDAENRCLLCACQFTMFRRQHHCRLCNALCCDDCSKKRVVLDSSSARVCDGCYNRAMHMLEESHRQEMLNRLKSAASTTTAGSVTTAAVHNNLDSDNRAELFGNTTPTGKSSAASVKDKRNHNMTSQTMNALSETHEKLQERGEKLSHLAVKSDMMANQANDFAKLAKQLNEQQKNRWF